MFQDPHSDFQSFLDALHTSWTLISPKKEFIA